MPFFSLPRRLSADLPDWCRRVLGVAPLARHDWPPEVRRAHELIAAVDAGGVPLNPLIVNRIARALGLEVSSKAPVEDTVARIRQALGRASK